MHLLSFLRDYILVKVIICFPTEQRFLGKIIIQKSIIELVTEKCCVYKLTKTFFCFSKM